MSNYYTDHPEIGFHLNHPLMKRIVELKERNYADRDKFDEAPVNYDDAIENYKQLLEITGDITANIIGPNSESVDQEGPHLENGRMLYASKTKENIQATRQAGLWGDNVHGFDRARRRIGPAKRDAQGYSRQGRHMEAEWSKAFYHQW